MMMRAMKWTACLAVLLTCAGSAQAAFIHWDDNDVNTITVTWGDFDFDGLSIDGSPATAAGTVTLADGVYTFSGSWVEENDEFSEFIKIYFALPGDPTDVTSGMNYSASGNGLVATISGGFGGFFGGPYFPSIDPTVAQDGHIEFFGSPGLSAFFDSEAPVAAVPEPASLTLVGMGAFGLIAGAIRRRCRQQHA